MSDRDNSYSGGGGSYGGGGGSYGGSRSRENQLFVGRLPKHVDEKVVRAKFAQYGTLVRCEVKEG